MTEFPLESQEIAPATMQATRPLYWSVRRELWENRSLYVAPLAVAGLFLFGFLMSTITLPRRMRGVLALDATRQRAAIEVPYDMVAGFIILTAFLVAVFYCLDALHSERRDRSILFWKSLPVSDRTTVLAKASIPLVVLPLFIFLLIVVVQMFMLFVSSTVLLGNSRSLSILWLRLPFVQMPIALIYALIAISLWHAPIYAWLLLVSAWARRATFLWAFLPPLAISAVEKMTFNTTHFAHLLGYRFIGWFARAFIPEPHGHVTKSPLEAMTPGTFLITPGLWIGLLFAAAFLAAAVRLRRNREPI